MTTPWSPNSPVSPTTFTEPNRPVSAYNPPVVQQIPGPTGPSGVLNIASARIATLETTTSTVFMGLATPGPAVTLDVPASGSVLAMISARCQNSVASGYAIVGISITGATIRAATTADSAYLQAAAANQEARIGIASLITGLNPGSTTFSLIYRVSAASNGTATFSDRQIIIIPIQ